MTMLPRSDKDKDYAKQLYLYVYTGRMWSLKSVHVGTSVLG